MAKTVLPNAVVAASTPVSCGNRAAIARRAEAFYALASNVVDPQQSDGLAGNLWAGALCQQLPAGTIDLRPHTDHPGMSGQFLKATRGNFGQFYISRMTQVGLLVASSSPIPLLTQPQRPTI